MSLIPSLWEGEARGLQVSSQPRSEWDLVWKTKRRRRQQQRCQTVSDCQPSEKSQSKPGGECLMAAAANMKEGSSALEDFCLLLQGICSFPFSHLAQPPRAKPVNHKVQLPGQAHPWHFLPTHSLGRAQELGRPAQGERQGKAKQAKMSAATTRCVEGLWGHTLQWWQALQWITEEESCQLMEVHKIYNSLLLVWTWLHYCVVNLIIQTNNGLPKTLSLHKIEKIQLLDLKKFKMGMVHMWNPRFDGYSWLSIWLHLELTKMQAARHTSEKFFLTGSRRVRRSTLNLDHTFLWQPV